MIAIVTVTASRMVAEVAQSGPFHRRGTPEAMRRSRRLLHALIQRISAGLATMDDCRAPSIPLAHLSAFICFRGLGGLFPCHFK